MDRIVSSHIQIFEFNGLNFDRQIGKKKIHIFNTRIFFIFRRWIFFELFVFTFNFLKISFSCWGPCVFYKIRYFRKKRSYAISIDGFCCVLLCSLFLFLNVILRGKRENFTLLETSRKPLSKMGCIFNLEF